MGSEISITKDIKVSKEKAAMWAGIILTLLMAMTNGEVKIINTIYVVLTFAGILVFPLSFSLASMAGVAIYLGYSYIELTTHIPFIQSAHTFQNFFYIIVMVKIFYEEGIEFLWQARKSIILFMVYITFTYLGVTKSYIVFFREIGMVYTLLWLFYDISKKGERSKMFMQAFMIILISVFIYNPLHNITEASNSARFAGVRDANNFSICCNVSLVFLLFMDNFKKLALPIAVMVIGCLLTVSVSGMVCMIAIFSVYFLFKKGTMTAVVFIGIVIIVALMFGPIVSVIDAMNIPFLDAYIGRISDITHQLSLGNYDVATTSRTFLWELHMKIFNNLPTYKQYFGDPYFMSELLTDEGILAPHNSFIDMLYSMGYIGTGLFLLVAINTIIYYVKQKQPYFALISFIFLVNAFFRSLSGFSLYFPILL